MGSGFENTVHLKPNLQRVFQIEVKIAKVIYAARYMFKHAIDCEDTQSLTEACGSSCFAIEKQRTSYDVPYPPGLGF